MFAAIGGIITVLVLKLLENDEVAAAQREIRGENDLNEAEKRPQEHDERFC